MIGDQKYKEKLLLKLKRFFNPGEWSAYLLGLSKSEGTAVSPGLIMIQIDGFSRKQLAQAFENNETPFLKSLLDKEHYNLYPFFPGLPSTTPSIQGELFYGVKQCVPAFFFYDWQTKKLFRMFDGDNVDELEKRLCQQGHNLLMGGSSYSNIFTGGAQEAHFCAGSLGWHKIWREVHLLKILLVAATHILSVIRMIILLLWEIILASMDFIYGLLKKEDTVTEFKFIFLRSGLCVLLRELITLGVKIDIARGLPIIHLNFIGYDEQAHRRGPSSQTAHWALKGIDKAISRIYSAAVHSSRRHYDVWIYSDHGQEKTTPYIGHYKKNVEETINGLFYQTFMKEKKSAAQKLLPLEVNIGGEQLHRGRYLGKWVEEIWPLNHYAELFLDQNVVTAAMGPMGGVYVLQDLSWEEKCLFAKELVRTAKIPLVLTVGQDNKIHAWNNKGEFIFPEEAGEILDITHPYFNEIVNDLIALCRHPNAGTFVISGWSKEGELFSFPFENGAHAGMGCEETNAFALLPMDVVKLPKERFYIKTEDLRKAALRLLKSSDIDKGNIERSSAELQKYSAAHTIRVMTYNVHSCVGTDGKVSPERIARVIARYEPDIVALQELDIDIKRTGGIDQPHFIAKELEMIHHFHPSFKVEEGQYGNAVLSRFPMQLRNADGLPSFWKPSITELRGAIWVDVAVNGRHLQFFNTHLSLFGREGYKQVGALLGREWISHPECKGEIVLCGDFNALPFSSVCRRVKQKLHDTQEKAPEHKPRPTWFSHYPLSRIDYIFVSDDIEVAPIRISQSSLEKNASDHLPLIVDIKFKGGSL